MKTRIRLLLIAALALTPAGAWAGGGACPAFTTAMIDAAWLAVDFSQPAPANVVELVNVPNEPRIMCRIELLPNNFFQVSVGAAEAELVAKGVNYDLGEAITTLLRTRVFNLTPGQEHTCRAQVLASFVWKQHCDPK